MKALLDGDIYAFRPAASAENDSLGIAIYRAEEMIEKTLQETNADSFSIFISGDSNFRKQIYPEYKANRIAPKPRFLADVKNYFKEKYNAEVAIGCEADDLLGVAQCGVPEGQTIICSIDKDLRMIPGWHYSFEISGKAKDTAWVRPMEMVYVNPWEALKRFYTQLLTGDPTDNIKGAVGIGKQKAEKLLRDCTTEQELLESVRDCFSCDEELLLNGQCLWIWRKHNDIWKIPEFETAISKSQGPELPATDS